MPIQKVRSRLSLPIFYTCIMLLSGCALLDAANGASDQNGNANTPDAQDTPDAHDGPDGNTEPEILNSAYSLSAGQAHTCAVRKSDSYFECWGEEGTEKRLGDPSNAYTSVEAGDWHTCALSKVGSTVECWGDVEAQPPVPSDAFKSISSGASDTCGITAGDGKIKCWGWNPTRGQLLPPDGSNFKAISVGQNHGCAIDADDKIQCWGYLHELVSSKIQTAIDAEAGPNTYRAVSVGANSTCAIALETSQVRCWTSLASPIPNPSPDIEFSAISSYDLRTCGVTNDAAIICWGATLLNQDPTEAQPKDDGAFDAIAIGANHTCAVEVTGDASKVVCWGQPGFEPTWTVPEDL